MRCYVSIQFNQQILEANNAALRLLDNRGAMLINSPIVRAFEDESSVLIRAMFEQTRTTGEANQLIATLADGEQAIEVSLIYMHSSSNSSI